MAQYVYCKAETELYIAQEAVCIQCADHAGKVKQEAATVPDVSDHPIRTLLLRDLVRAMLVQAQHSANSI